MRNSKKISLTTCGVKIREMYKKHISTSVNNTQKEWESMIIRDKLIIVEVIVLKVIRFSCFKGLKFDFFL